MGGAIPPMYTFFCLFSFQQHTQSEDKRDYSTKKENTTRDIKTHGVF